MTHAEMLAEAHRLIRADVEHWTRILELAMAAVLLLQADRLTKLAQRIKPGS